MRPYNCRAGIITARKGGLIGATLAGLGYLLLNEASEPLVRGLLYGVMGTGGLVTAASVGLGMYESGMLKRLKPCLARMIKPAGILIELDDDDVSSADCNELRDVLNKKG